MRWWQGAQIVALAVSPFVLADYQRRVWVKAEAARKWSGVKLWLDTTIDTMKLVEVVRAMSVTAAEAAGAYLRLGQALTEASSSFDDLASRPTPIGDWEMTPVRLDECWRCSRAVPRDDPLGLCPECRTQLRNL